MAAAAKSNKVKSRTAVSTAIRGGPGITTKKMKVANDSKGIADQPSAKALTAVKQVENDAVSSDDVANEEAEENDADVSELGEDGDDDSHALDDDDEIASDEEQPEGFYGGSEDDDNEDEDDEEDDDDEGNDDEVALAGRKSLTGPREHLYNAAAMLGKLQEIAWPRSVPWIETLTLTVGPDGAQPYGEAVSHDALAHSNGEGNELTGAEAVDAADDLAREVAFYAQAVDGAKAGLRLLQAEHDKTYGPRKGGEGTATDGPDAKAERPPLLRPSDYYAEMVKGDSHMERVRASLLARKQQLEGSEERMKAREAARYSKEVAAERKKERAKDRKEQVAAVEKWRKKRKQNDYKDDMGGDSMPEDFPVDLGGEDVGKKERGRGRDGRGGRGAAKSAMKRQLKDSKYGFGGRKRLKKQNDADSTNAFDFPEDSAGPGYGMGGGSRGGRGRGGGRGGGGGRGRGGFRGIGRGGNRPGKGRREQMRKS